MKNRINSIECRKIKSVHYSHEIVVWEENHYFGKEEDFELSFGGEFYRLKEDSAIGISKNHFTNPEYCYVVAFLIKGKEVYDLRTVGNRVLDLSPQDLEDFMKVYRKAVRYE